MEWVAIDFETANGKRNSACALGIALVKDGRVRGTASFLIRPPKLKFNPQNVKVHGITASDVADQPTFDQVWHKIGKFFNSKVVVAHNAAFDLDVLRSVLDTYDLPYPDITGYCTLDMACTFWPQLPNHRLDTVSEHLGIKFDHHRAVDDAVASAEITLVCCQKVGMTDLTALARKYKIPQRHLESKRQIRAKTGEIEERSPNGSAIRRDGNPEGYLYGEVLCFTGDLAIPREEAADLAASVGCTVVPGVTKKTTLLVVGDQDIRKLAGHSKSSKHRKAEELISKGQDIRIIGESDFKALVSEAG